MPLAAHGRASLTAVSYTHLFMLLGCFLLMYLGVLGYVVLEAFGDLF